MTARYVATVELDGMDVDCYRAGTSFITRINEVTVGIEDVAMLALSPDGSLAFQECMA